MIIFGIFGTLSIIDATDTFGGSSKSTEVRYPTLIKVSSLQSIKCPHP